MKTESAFIFGAAVFFTLLNIAIIAGVIYVAVHFLAKVW